MIGPLAIGASAAVASLGGCAYAVVWPSCQLWGPAIWRGPADSRGVAMTFDDGPTPGPTDSVLDALKAHNARATFFVIGENVRRNPDLLRRIDAEGHLIGNHTFAHWHYGFICGRRYWDREMRRTDELIESILGRRPTYFRPPMGLKTLPAAIAARRRGHTMVTWSLRAIDGVPTTSQRILERFESVSGGDILVLHDGSDPQVPHRDRSAAGKVIKPLVEMIRAKGLEPMRLDEMLTPTSPRSD